MKKIIQNRLFGKPIDLNKKAFLTPKERYQLWDNEFHFDFDPCPYPRPKDFDGLRVEWGRANYVNPPFNYGDSLVPWARKAIEEYKKGKLIVMVMPIYYSPALLLEAGAEVRSITNGRVWSSVIGEKGRIATDTALFILKPKVIR